MRMWQKAFSTLLLIIVNNAYASWQGNWLVGASGVYADRRGAQDISLRYAAIPVFPTLEAHNVYSNKGFGWGLLAGYQIKSEGWLWGIESSIDWQDIAQKRSVVFTDQIGLFSWSGKSLYDRKPIIALSGRMAYEMAPYFIPYIRLGVEGSEDSIELSIASSNAALIIPNTVTVSSRRWDLHYLAGFGVETPLWCTPVTIRLEYNYHSRASSLNANGQQGLNIGGGVVVDPAFVFVSEIHNRTQSAKLSFVWNFY